MWVKSEGIVRVRAWLESEGVVGEWGRGWRVRAWLESEGVVGEWGHGWRVRVWLESEGVVGEVGEWGRGWRVVESLSQHHLCWTIVIITERMILAQNATTVGSECHYHLPVWPTHTVGEVASVRPRSIFRTTLLELPWPNISGEGIRIILPTGSSALPRPPEKPSKRRETGLINMCSWWGTRAVWTRTLANQKP